MAEFLSTSEVAKMLKISRIAILKKISKGQIKAFKIGRNYVIPKEETLKLLGLVIGEDKKKEIDKIIHKATKEYREVFKRLGRE